MFENVWASFLHTWVPLTSPSASLIPGCNAAGFEGRRYKRRELWGAANASFPFHPSMSSLPRAKEETSSHPGISSVAENPSLFLRRITLRDRKIPMLCLSHPNWQPR